LQKFYPVCQLKIPESTSDTADTDSGGIFIKSINPQKKYLGKKYDSKN